MRVLFAPIGILAGFAAQKGFELEGAIFRLVRGMVDRGARLGFASLTGRWPGEEARAA